MSNTAVMEKTKSASQLDGKRPRGRPKGSKNKRGLVEGILLDKLGEDYSPLVTLAEIAMNRKVSAPTRVAAAGKLADFLYPRKGVEAPQMATQAVSIAINLDGSEPKTVTIDAEPVTDEAEDD